MLNRSLKPLALHALVVLSIVLSACGNNRDAEQKKAAPEPAPIVQSDEQIVGSSHNDSIVRAINVGGPAYRGADGIRYEGDQLTTAADKGTIGEIDGAQDPVIYQTYRRGEMSIGLPLANGHYDVTLMFAEPDQVPVGSRIFNVHAEGRAIVPELDVRKARDGRVRSALGRISTRAGSCRTVAAADLPVRRACGLPAGRVAGPNIASCDRPLPYSGPARWDRSSPRV